MFELASALFSIADANEFRFARFYIVCEEALLALLKVRPLSAVVGHLSRIVKTWKDTESDTKRGIEEMLPFCFKGFRRRLAVRNRAGTDF